MLLLGGKTIVGGLLGGWIVVEVLKRRLGVTARTGDVYVGPLILGMVIGRIGCFLAGLSDGTYGVATSLPWGVDFGDGISRHPTQLYEIVFLILIAWILFRPSLPSTPPNGLRFRALILSYAIFRLLVDFLKPYDRVWGMNPIQWACLIALCLCYRDLLPIARVFGPRVLTKTV